MRAGPLDRRIVIERLTTTTAASGAVVEVWTADPEIWAQYTTTGGSERFAAFQVEDRADAVFRVRWHDAKTVRPKDRVAYGGELWDIVAVLELGRQDGLELVCRRQIAAGEAA